MQRPPATPGRTRRGSKGGSTKGKKKGLALTTPVTDEIDGQTDETKSGGNHTVTDHATTNVTNSRFSQLRDRDADIQDDASMMPAEEELLVDTDEDMQEDATVDEAADDVPLAFEPSLLSIGGFTRTDAKSQLDLAASVWPMYSHVRPILGASSTPSRRTRSQSRPRGLDERSEYEHAAVEYVQQTLHTPNRSRTDDATTTQSFLSPGSLFAPAPKKDGSPSLSSSTANDPLMAVSTLDLGFGGPRTQGVQRRIPDHDWRIISRPFGSHSAASHIAPIVPTNLRQAAFPSSPYAASFGSARHTGPSAAATFPSSTHAEFQFDSPRAVQRVELSPASLRVHHTHTDAGTAVSSSSARRSSSLPKPRRDLLTRREVFFSALLFGLFSAARQIWPSIGTDSLHALYMLVLLALLFTRGLFTSGTRTPMEQKVCILVTADLTRRSVWRLVRGWWLDDVLIETLYIHLVDAIHTIVMQLPSITNQLTLDSVLHLASQYYELILVGIVLLVLLLRGSSEGPRNSREEIHIKPEALTRELPTVNHDSVQAETEATAERRPAPRTRSRARSLSRRR